MTELYRDRSYLEYVLTERSEAKEIRSYGIAPTLRSWHQRAVGHPHGAAQVAWCDDASR